MKVLAVSLCLLACGAAAEEARPALRSRPATKLGTPVPLSASSRSVVRASVKKPSLAVRGGGPIPEMSSTVAMIIGAAGIFFSFSVMAVFQEDVYKKLYGGEKFAFTFFVLIVDRGLNALSALLGVKLLGSSGLTIPLVDIFFSGVSQMFAMFASNEALRYVSYPTQVLGKSCKMVPVMAGGIVLGGKKYTLIEYAQVALITIGVCVFNFGGKSKKSGQDSPLGLFLIAASLFMDMVTGGLQDRVKMRTKELNPMAAGPKRPSMHESMLWTNASGFLVALLLGLFSGHLFGGIKFCTRHPQVKRPLATASAVRRLPPACMRGYRWWRAALVPSKSATTSPPGPAAPHLVPPPHRVPASPPRQMLYAILVYSLSSAVGGNFVYFTLTQFNPLVLTTVTTTRKIFSTLYSIFRNPANSLNGMQWSGTLMVFAGLLGDIARKLSAKPPAPKPPPPPPPPIEDAPASEPAAAAPKEE